MRIATITFAAAGALALFASGCGGKCSNETPPVKASVPNCTASPGATVSVPLQVCPRCDQGTPTCAVHMETVAQGAIQLEPLSEVCDSNSSCPIVDPASCPASPLTCTFAAPAANTTPYELVVITPEGEQLTGQLTVTSGSSSSCAL